MTVGKSLLLLCGNSSLDTAAFSEVVVLSPARLFDYGSHTHGLHTLSDFAPNEATGEAADKALYRNLDRCLHAEANANHDLRWAPVAYMQVQLRLSRYCWLKRTLAKMLQQLAPDSITLSSAQDGDLLHAVRTLTGSGGITLELHNGALDQSTARLHRVRPYGLPQHHDPHWLTRFRWKIWRTLRGKCTCLMQPYWNFDLRDKNLFLFRSFSVISFGGRILARLLEALQIRNRDAIFDNPIDLQEGLPRIFRHELWQTHFPPDELHVINNLLTAFVSDFSAPLLDGLEQALLDLFDTIGIRRVVMLHDRLDACRMIAHAAHRRGIAVDYLPHGLIIEDFSGEAGNSPFSPDRVLAWNEPSAHAFRQLGWNATTVTHPQFERSPAPFRGLHKNWPTTQVLVLIPEWVCVTQGAQEDCALRDMIEIYAGLTMLGLNPENIHIKLHSATSESHNAKRTGLIDLRDRAKMKFTLLDTSARTADLIGQYDLVIMGLTTGLFEAVTLGVPALIFGLSPARVGGLADCTLPGAGSRNELAQALRDFDDAKTGCAYAALAAYLRAGKKIVDVLHDNAVPA